MKNKMQSLLIQNKAKSQPLNTLLNADEGEDEATIYFYGVIVDDDYWGGISPLSFAKELAALSC